MKRLGRVLMGVGSALVAGAQVINEHYPGWKYTPVVSILGALIGTYGGYIHPAPKSRSVRKPRP